MIDYDLRRTLSAGQKSYLTRLYNKYSEIVDKPDNFIHRKVHARTLQTAKDANLPEYRVINGRIYTPKYKGEKSIRITSSKSGDLKVTRISKSKTRKVTINKDARKIFDTIKRLEKKLEKYQNMGIPAVLQARFGDDMPIQQAFDSAEEMQKYMQKFSDQQLRYMSVVVFDPETDEVL